MLHKAPSDTERCQSRARPLLIQQDLSDFEPIRIGSASILGMPSPAAVAGPSIYGLDNQPTAQAFRSGNTKTPSPDLTRVLPAACPYPRQRTMSGLNSLSQPLHVSMWTFQGPKAVQTPGNTPRDSFARALDDLGRHTSDVQQSSKRSLLSPCPMITVTYIPTSANSSDIISTSLGVVRILLQH